MIAKEILVPYFIENRSLDLFDNMIGTSPTAKRLYLTRHAEAEHKWVSLTLSTNLYSVSPQTGQVSSLFILTSHVTEGG